MSTLLSNNYLANRPIERAMQAFATRLRPSDRVLDIGCGNKPYAHFFTCAYVGLDPDQSCQPDVVGNAWALPFPDASFDALILNQSMEHIAKTTQTVEEIKRVLKRGGVAIITVPQTMKNHGIPLPIAQAPVHNFSDQQLRHWYVDYYRFTKYGLVYLFQDFTIVSVKETNGYAGTIFQLLNYFLASFGIDTLFRPLYFINNLVGVSCDWIAQFLRNLNIGIITKAYELIYTTLTINYIMVVRKS